MPWRWSLLSRALSLRQFGLISLLALAEPRFTRAEESISYKYQNYRESGGRIAVNVQGAAFEKDVGPLQLKAYGVVDSIAGATPDGRPPTTPGGDVPMAQLEERRKAWSLDLGHQFSRLKLNVGGANSRESDYVSHGWSVQAFTEFNQKNTGLNVGVAGTDDDVKVRTQTAWEQKESIEIITGINQLLDATTSLTFNLTYSESTGYLSDPYKIIQKQTEILPGLFLPLTYAENRPRSRTKWLAFAGINHAFARVNAAVDASVRLHTDNFGLNSQTVQLEWYQKVGARFIVRPHVRYFRQDSAEFYYVSLDNLPIVPTRSPTRQSPFYSADYRLSALESLSFGIKLVCTVTDTLQLDLATERYEMRGRDQVTSASAYPSASIFTAGVRLKF